MWTNELSNTIENALAARAKETVLWIFCARLGDCYVKVDGSANAFDSLWQRFMNLARTMTRVKYHFQEKDLRKKAASDMGLHAAKELLGHKDLGTTRAHYRLRVEKIYPHMLID